MRSACINGNNYKSLKEVPTIGACKEKCTEDTDTLCMSIDYNPSSHACNLQELRSDSSDYMEPCHTKGWLYSERNIEDGNNEPHCDWPNGQQYWPHPSDCHMFIQCTSHGPYEMTCAPGTAWSQSLLTCDYVDNTDCGKQTPPPPPSTQPPPPPAPSCPAPYKMRGDECLFVSEDGSDLLDWDESHQKCLDMGGSLAMPHDMVDFVAYIKESYNNSKSTIWLGATDREVEQEWKWLSGEPVPANMWKPWPGNQPSGDGNCMEIHYWPNTDFYMNDWHCNKQGHYACEFDMTPPPPPPSCPAPYKMRGDECFFVTEDGIEPLNWDDSRQKCLDMGGDLAMPHDMVDFVAYIKEIYPNSKSTIWLGATDMEVEQEWKWVSGESVPAEMWKPWPHNQPSGDGNCMEIHYWPNTDFYMNDWHCNKQGHYACEFDMSGK